MNIFDFDLWTAENYFWFKEKSIKPLRVDLCLISDYKKLYARSK